MFRQAFISSLPDEMLEAGRIDHMEFKLFFSFALPMVRPMVGTFILITCLGAWNNYIGPQIIIKSPEMLPLSVAVAQLRSEYGQDYGMLMAGTLVSTAPIMLLFPMLRAASSSRGFPAAVKG
ncbi:MAG: ABC transporter permease subunit [Phycisphaerales bacterium]